jgi:hypothetical protein
MNFKVISSNFYDLQSQKILSFSNFISDFYFNVSFKRYIKFFNFLVKFFNIVLFTIIKYFI